MGIKLSQLHAFTSLLRL